jgi:hypothetical protein
MAVDVTEVTAAADTAAEEAAADTAAEETDAVAADTETETGRISSTRDSSLFYLTQHFILTQAQSSKTIFPVLDNP